MIGVILEDMKTRTVNKNMVKIKRGEGKRIRVTDPTMWDGGEDKEKLNFFNMIFHCLIITNHYIYNLH